MDDVAQIIPILWDIAKNRKQFAVNIMSKEKEIIVSILSGNRWKRFKNKNAKELIHDIKESYIFF